KDQFVDLVPVFSPDGRWLAYESLRSGGFDLYVRPFSPTASGQSKFWTIANVGASNGFHLAWSRNELYYQSGDQIMATGYTTEGDAFKQGNTRMWIPKLGGLYWDVAPDGKRVAVVTPVGSAEGATSDHTVVFLQNFLDYLKQQVPLNK